MRHRRLCLLATALVALAASPTQAAQPPVSSHAVSTVAGTGHDGIPIIGASLTQRGNALRLRVGIAGGRAGVIRGGRVCARISAPTKVTWCVVRKSGGLWGVKVNAAPHADATPVGSAWVESTLPLAELSLRPGSLRWTVSTQRARCDAASATPCRSELPTAAPAKGRLWTPVASGCAARPGLVTQGAAGSHRIALTFDDGPAADTAQVRAVLEREHVPATFFVIGRQVSGRAAELRALLRDGDEIGDHTWDHANLSGGGDAATSELSRTNAAVRAATGFTPCVFRPPYGAVGGDLVERAGALHMATILWSVDPQDWASPGTGAIIDRVLSATGDGAIILDHDGGGPRGETVAAIASYIPVLKQRGDTFVTVSQLLGFQTTYALRP